MLRLADKHPDQDYQHRLCAVCFKGSRVVSYGFNSPRTQASIADIANRVNGMYADSTSDWVSYCTHAEVAAIKKSNTQADTLVVVRKTKSNRVGMARPCNICAQYIKNAGIKTVIYSQDDGSFRRMV